MQTLKLSELFPVLNSSTVTEPSLSLTVTLGDLNSTVTIIGAASEVKPYDILVNSNIRTYVRNTHVRTYYVAAVIIVNEQHYYPNVNKDTICNP